MLLRHFAIVGVAAVALGSGVLPTRTAAQTLWENGGSPVFESQIREHRRAVEATREAARARARARLSNGGARPKIQPQSPQTIKMVRQEPTGTVIIDTQGRRLFYVIEPGRAYLYPISVGRTGFTWTGTEKVSRVQTWPSWTPPPEMRRRQSWLPMTMSGGVRNPLGAKAIYLGDTLYRIHGTNEPKSIGRAASSGCFRMMNKHVLHLAGLVETGTEVRVVKSYDPDSPAPPAQPEEPGKTSSQSDGAAIADKKG